MLRKKQNTSRLEKELLKGEQKKIKIKKIITEFVKGFKILKKYNKAATFFGSARTNSENKIYKDTEQLASKLVSEDFTIITGGGGGIMEAANKGAIEAGGNSVGLNINLPQEQVLNPYINDSEKFDYFFIRKLMLSYASEVYIYFPGGFGTLDEFFETVMLIQNKKIKSVPIILLGKEYWQPLLKWIKDEVLGKHRYIDEKDLDIFYLCETIDEALDIIKKLAPKDKK